MTNKNDKKPEKFPKSDVAKTEEKIIDFWEKSKTFEKSVEKEAPKGDYVFYDGPPFGTGEPHYGHILSSVAKDVVPRYWTMKGYRVERRWGWDCHGLPIENIIEKDMGISGKKEIEKMGIDKFNEACRARVLEYADVWDVMVKRIARWVEFKNSYKTMDPEYMESVWWGFKELWEKGLIYQGRKVLLYCPRCETPISNFEVAMDNSYKEITEPSVYVDFKIKYKEGKTGRGVGVLILNDNNEVLLVKRNEPGRRITWALPGGKVDKEESFREALDREVMEELGVEVESAKAFCGLPDILEGRIFETICYKTKVKGKPKNMIPDELEKIKWFSLDKLPEIDYPPSRDALRIYIKNKEKFYITEDVNRPLSNVYILAWTTTPWTLPGNVALAVGGDIDYVMLKQNNEYYIVAKERLEVIEGDYEQVKEFKGKELIGLTYEPLFDVPALRDSGKNVYTVADADFVTTEDGTGVVHTAVVYGEDDYNFGLKLDMPIEPALDEKGHFNDTVPQFKGMYFKKADKEIIKDLDKRGLLFRAVDYAHSYPHCHRCDTQLFYNAIPAWFLSIEKIRKNLIKQNKNINWYPEHLKEGRFKIGIEQAPDWNISRNRYFATPMPIWECDKCKVREVIGSIEELKKKSGQKDISDIHSHYIDSLSWKCPKCEGTMKRIKEVFDCWVESGSMSFAQHHYPFENKKKFEDTFPAQYISEYIPQTRAWFYVMHVMSTALFNKNSFENVVTTGVILNEEGKKMSKSKKNYPDPWKVINQFGVDALRYYLMSSTLMHAGNLFFSERELRDVFRKNIMMTMNVYRFYSMFAPVANDNESETNNTNIKEKDIKSEHILDKWILSRLNQLIAEATARMDNYDLPRATRPIIEFIDDLSTWYLRRSRDRFKGGDENDKKAAIATTGFVLIQLSKVIAPFMPFIAEKLWQEVGGKNFQDENASVHLENWPKPGKVDEKILKEMVATRKIVELGLAARDEAKIKVRQPLNTLRVVAPKTIAIRNPYIALIKDEVNVKEVEFTGNADEISVKLNTEISPELRQEGMKRELVRTINAMRKKAGLTIKDRIEIVWQGSQKISEVIKKYEAELLSDTLAVSIISNDKTSKSAQTVVINGESVAIKIIKK